MGNEKKKKKEKITYIDDGSTVFDMTGVGGARSRNTGKPPKEQKKPAPRLLPGSHSTMKEQAQTFFGAMRMMFLPMLATIGLLTLIYLFFRFLL